MNEIGVCPRSKGFPRREAQHSRERFYTCAARIGVLHSISDTPYVGKFVARILQFLIPLLVVWSTTQTNAAHANAF